MKVLENNRSFHVPGLLNCLLWLILPVTVLFVVVPFAPLMPRHGYPSWMYLDPSWMFAVNHAVGQGLSFGREIIFSFGPYGSVFTRNYHPATDLMMIVGAVFLALSHWACLSVLMAGARRFWVAAYCVILAGVAGGMGARDALLFSMPLVAGLSVFKAAGFRRELLHESKYAPVYIALAFAPLGLLPLVKGSLIIICGAIIGLTALYFAFEKKAVPAMACLAAPFISMVLFWAAAGQPVTYLPGYFRSMVPIISGYTGAMSIDGRTPEIFVYLGVSALLMLLLSLQKKVTGPLRIFLLLAFFAFLFLSFKQGFVRHDGHALTAGAAVLIAATLSAVMVDNRAVYPVVILSLIACFYITLNYIEAPGRLPADFLLTYSSSWQGLKARITDGGLHARQFESAVDALREEAGFPVLEGKTDVYSYNQSFLIASGNNWVPRPVFQSYKAYTPMLAETNRGHLLGPEAPDNIVFRVQPIDGRLPALEDGASWPVLALNYEPAGMIQDYFFLKKKNNRATGLKFAKISSGTYGFGERVPLPGPCLVFAEIEVKAAFWGRAANIFFKPGQLMIDINLQSGARRQYRFIPGAAKSGFLISPLAGNTAEFAALYEGASAWEENVVRDFAVMPVHGRTSHWHPEYSVVLSIVETAYYDACSRTPGFNVCR